MKLVLLLKESEIWNEKPMSAYKLGIINISLKKSIP